MKRHTPIALNERMCKELKMLAISYFLDVSPVWLLQPQKTTGSLLEKELEKGLKVQRDFGDGGEHTTPEIREHKHEAQNHLALLPWQSISQVTMSEVVCVSCVVELC